MQTFCCWYTCLNKSIQLHRNVIKFATIEQTEELTVCRQHNNKCRDIVRKPTYDFSFIGNSNVCYICHRLWDNRVCTSEILPVRISNLQVDDQDQQERHRRLRRWMANWMVRIWHKNGGSLSYRSFLLVHRSVVYSYELSALRVKDSEILSV